MQKCHGTFSSHMEMSGSLYPLSELWTLASLFFQIPWLSFLFLWGSHIMYVDLLIISHGSLSSAKFLKYFPLLSEDWVIFTDLSSNSLNIFCVICRSFSLSYWAHWETTKCRVCFVKKLPVDYFIVYHPHKCICFVHWHMLSFNSRSMVITAALKFASWSKTAAILGMHLLVVSFLENWSMFPSSWRAE